MSDLDRILQECKTLSPGELQELLQFIGYLKFRAATGGDDGAERKLDRSDA